MAPPDQPSPSDSPRADTLPRSSSNSSLGFRFQSPFGQNRQRQDRQDGQDDEDSARQLGDELDHDDSGETEWPRLRRRSSIGHRLAALTDVGGVNSIRSFTRSWQRAAGFAEVLPQPPSFVFASDQEPFFPNSYDSRSRSYLDSVYDEEAVGSPLLLPRQAESIGGIGGVAGSVAVTSSSDNASFNASRDDAATSHANHEHNEHKSLLGSDLSRTLRYRAGSNASIFGYPPPLAAAAAAASVSGADGASVLGASPVVGSYLSDSFRSHRSYRSTRRSVASAGYGSVGSAGLTTYDPMAGALGRRGSRGSQASQASVGGEVGSAVEGEIEGEDEHVALLTADERPAILVREVEEDGKIILAVEGQSTLPQTIFNSINVLIGVGLLSLPMGLKYAGWICGMATLLLAAAVTAYTARLLAKCMDLDPSVITFSDLAFISFGPRARLVTSLLFTVELLAACVALIVLFADSLGLLFPGLLSAREWKAICCLIMIPLNFLPMRLLSVTSIIGIVCCFSIVSIVIIDGLSKKTTPGSLLQPAATYLFPANWLTLPLSFGLLMSPWGGHSVFPNIYRDMRHPVKYARAVKITFGFTYLLDATTAVVGILMFGDDVMDEITANILTTSGYSSALTVLLCLMIGIIPLTKIPLNARPIITTIEVLLGIQQQQQQQHYHHPQPESALVSQGLLRVLVRVLTILSFFVISVVFPDFDSIMAFMGSALCFTICVTLPILFHLKLFGHTMSSQDKAVQYAVLSVSLVLSTVGTVWSFLPKSLLGAE